MGTNYYAYKQVGEVCPTCGRGETTEEIHIGKASAGWCFGLHVTEEIANLDAWIKVFAQPGTIIKDEYGIPITSEQMLSIIRDRSWGPRRPGFDIRRMEGVEEGPNGLLRHKIGNYCSGHGEGTYDLMPHEFS